jgi:hypothetical protein
MSDEEMVPLYEAVARDRTIESAVALASALAEKVLEEKDFVQERSRIRQRFAEQREAIRRGQGGIPPEVKLYREDKLFELRQWLFFLRHSYAASAAGLKAALEVLSASHAVGRIHSLRLEQAGRELGKHGEVYAETRKALDAAGPALLSLHRDTAKNTLSLSRVAYRKVERGLRRVHLRSLGRFLRRHTFLWVAGFLGASYLLGKLLDAVQLPGNATVSALVGLILAAVVWALDRSVFSPWIDRRFEKYRKADAEADLADLEDAFLWAHMSQVFSASVLRDVLKLTEDEYKTAVKELTDPNFPPSGRGLSHVAGGRVPAQADTGQGGEPGEAAGGRGDQAHS